MDRHDLNLAFYRRLIALAYNGMETIRPDQIFDATNESNTETIRRGVVILNEPQTIGFGNGVYSRIEGIYQIDIWVPRSNENAFKTCSELSDAHLLHFFPANGRGLTVTENTTSAHITRRPAQRHLGREGAYLREVIEIEFYTDINPSA